VENLWVFVCFLLAYLLSDFVIGGKREGRETVEPSFRGEVRRAISVGLFSYLLMGDWDLWQAPLLIAGTHLLVDLLYRQREGMELGSFVTRQVIRLSVMSVLALLLGQRGARLELYWIEVFGTDVLAVFVVIAGLIATVQAGASLVDLFVRPFLDEIQEQREEAEDLEQPRGRGWGLEKGGRTIGQLERFLIFLFVLTGNPAGVGFLIAAKSIFRFGELKEPGQRMEAEYILIGTLMSVGYALAVAYATRYCLKIL
jgi:hypothetical protein